MATKLPSNEQLVTVNGMGQIEVLAPRTRMTADQALAHAAYLVRYADPDLVRFNDAYLWPVVTAAKA